MLTCLLATGCVLGAATPKAKVAKPQTKAAGSQKTNNALVDPKLSLEENKIITLLEEMMDLKQNPEKSYAEYAQEIISIADKNPKLKTKYQEAYNILVKTKKYTQLIKLQKEFKPLLGSALPESAVKHLKKKLLELGFLKIVNKKEQYEMSKIAVAVKNRLKPKK